MNIINLCFLSLFYFRWFAPSSNRNESRYVPWGGMLPWNTHPVTLQMTRRQMAGNKFIDANKSVSRVQSYSPTLRAAQGGKSSCGGIQLAGESMLDHANKIIESDDGGYIRADVVHGNLKRYLNLAHDHLSLIAEGTGTVCRLELTFKGDRNGLDNEFYESSLGTLMKTFHGSIKAYDCKVITDLGRIVLLAMDALGKASIHSRTSSYLPFIGDYDEFAEVWTCLKYMAINFFSGRNRFLPGVNYCPKLSYLYSRCLLKSSWKGVNAAFEKMCYSKENFALLKKEWYKFGGIDADRYEKIIVKNASFLNDLDSGINTSLDAFNRLYIANCNRQSKSQCRALVCSYCRLMTSEAESVLPIWKDHPCRIDDQRLHSQKLLMSIYSEEYQNYIRESILALSLSQQLCYYSILDSEKNFFLTGVAGSGKSHTLQCLYPQFVFYYGYHSVQLTATTNRAAANINGITVHRLLGLTVDRSSRLMINTRGPLYDVAVENHIQNLANTKTLEKLTLLKCLIIDEAGMLTHDLHYFLSAILKKVKNNSSPFGGVRIILVGDVLQLPPIKEKKKDLNFIENGNNFFFVDKVNFNSKFYNIAYLRENHRQKNEEFLAVLNMVRIGDREAIDLLNGVQYSGTRVSRSTLALAKQHINTICNSKSINDSLNSRLSFGYLLKNRIYPSREELGSLETRIKNAIDSQYSDLIVCCEKTESEAYRVLRCQSVLPAQRFISLSSDQSFDLQLEKGKTSNETDFIDMETKLAKNLEIIVGMQYRISCHTDNKFFCTNTLVTVEKINLQNSKIVDVQISTKDPSSTVISITLKRITLKELRKDGKTLISRSQFPLSSSIGLLPWSLQCMTISENIFYDNSRMGGSLGEPQKGFLYAILSRVKHQSQICFLYPITSREVCGGVNLEALKFDDLYRKTNNIIMAVID